MRLLVLFMFMLSSFFGCATSDNYWKILDINRNVNFYWDQKEDKKDKDVWTLFRDGKVIGDCDDGAVTKKFILYKTGKFKKNELQLILGYRDISKNKKEWHLSLLVKIKEGFFILDGGNGRKPYHFPGSKYKWVIVQNGDNWNVWEEIISTEPFKSERNNKLYNIFPTAWIHDKEMTYYYPISYFVWCHGKEAELYDNGGV